MKLRLLAVALTALTLVAGPAVAQDITSEKGKLGYALGYDLGRSVAASGENVDVASIVKGLQDGHAQREPAVSVEQMRAAVQAMQARQQAKAKAAWDKAVTDNAAKSSQFLAQNKAKAGVRILPNGVQYRVLQTGNGAKPTMNSTVELVVSGPFPWGQRPPQVKANQIPGIKLSEVRIPAMREVLTQMQAGSKWEVTLPSDKAYGADPRSGFPPNVAVQFEVHLVSVK